jgi:Carboxypeptidase regulatory-like domain
MLGILVGIALTAGTVTESELTGSFSGVVKEAGTGSPLTEAQVITRSLPVVVNGVTTTSGKSKQITVAADAQGRYKLSELPAGRYFVLARSTNRLGPSGFRIVTLRAGQHLTSIDFELRPPGVISGKVLDDNKEPVPGAAVYAMSREYYSGALEYLIKMGSTTNDRGEYVLPLLEPGRAYLVRAEKREPRPVSRAPADPKLRRKTLAPAYYSNSIAIEGAAPLVLRAGERREGVDIVVTRSLSYCIEGLLETGGRPAELDFTLAEESISPGDGPKPGGASGPDGRIRVCGLQPGQYRITAEALGTAEEAPLFGSTAVTITDRDVRGVRVTAGAGVPLSGEVVWDGTPPDERVTAKVSISLDPLNRMRFMGEQTDAKSSIPGEFSFPSLLMGEYGVWAGAASLPGVYVKDILYGGRSVRNKPLRLGSAIAGAELRVVLGRDGGSFSVRVADKDGNSIPDSFVLIMPADVYSESELAAALVSGRTDQDGLYSSYTLAPGKYYALASSAEIDRTPESINKLWRARLTKAKEVELSSGKMAQVTLEPVVID